MSSPVEIYETLDLKNTKTTDFKNANSSSYDKAEGKIDYKFLLIEIKSHEPPTDCFFTINHITHSSTKLKTIKIHSMKYRKDFIYENGIYILYLDMIKDFTEDIVPLHFNFTNKRDVTASAKLFYMASFLSS